MKFVFIVLVAIIASACSPTREQMNRSTVKITVLSKQGGGTGSIISSRFSGSKVLTNKHVCDAIAKGGIVTTEDGKDHQIKSMKASSQHDLCIITTTDNLGVFTRIAERPLAPLESVYVSGHPRLLPNIITEGHYAGVQHIQVLMEQKPCTEQDFTGKDALACAILGFKPVVKDYDALALSALIQPGSSGSAVYNDMGEIAAVIFAGSGDISFGFAVPWEYVYKFVYDMEAKTPPPANRTPSEAKIEPIIRKRVNYSKIQEFCRRASTQYEQTSCKALSHAKELL